MRCPALVELDKNEDPRAEGASAICLNRWVLMNLSKSTNVRDRGIWPQTPPDAAVGNQKSPKESPACRPDALMYAAQPRFISDVISITRFNTWFAVIASWFTHLNSKRNALRKAELPCFAGVLSELFLLLLTSSSDLFHPPSFTVFHVAAASPLVHTAPCRTNSLGALQACLGSRWLLECVESRRDTDGLHWEMIAGRDQPWERLTEVWPGCGCL